MLYSVYCIKKVFFYKKMILKKYYKNRVIEKITDPSGGQAIGGPCQAYSRGAGKGPLPGPKRMTLDVFLPKGSRYGTSVNPEKIQRTWMNYNESFQIASTFLHSLRAQPSSSVISIYPSFSSPFVFPFFAFFFFFLSMCSTFFFSFSLLSPPPISYLYLHL